LPENIEINNSNFDKYEAINKGSVQKVEVPKEADIQKPKNRIDNIVEMIKMSTNEKGEFDF